MNYEKAFRNNRLMYWNRILQRQFIQLKVYLSLNNFGRKLIKKSKTIGIHSGYGFSSRYYLAGTVLFCGKKLSVSPFENKVQNNQIWAKMSIMRKSASNMFFRFRNISGIGFRTFIITYILQNYEINVFILFSTAVFC